MNRGRGIIFLILSLLLSGTLFPGPASGMRLTYATHLFDITHDFSQPSDVSVAPDGRIYVVDGVNNKIKVFLEDGSFSFSFGRKGSQNGEFQFPLGIGIGSSGLIYVADSGNHRIQIFSPHGSYLNHFMVPSREGTPSDPTDVAVDESGNRCYVVDNDNHYVLAYDLSKRELLKTFGSPGEEKNEFRFPFLIALDKYQYLYVVDVINTRVQLLSPEGLLVTTIGGWGVEKGEFYRPKGIAIDGENRSFVSDSYLGVIQVFDATGKFYSALGDSTTKKIRKFTTPTGIFIDGRDRLYVVEMFAEKVSVFALGGDSE